MTVRRIATAAAVAAVMSFGLAGPATAAPQAESSAELVSVIVRELPGAGDRAERAVASFGGTVERQIGIIDGFTAMVPADRVGLLRGLPGVLSVTEDARIELLDTEVEAVKDQPGSMYRITTDVTGAHNYWDRGFDGTGVDVAVIDSGVVPVNGLRAPGKVVHGPDLSFEADTCDSLGGNCTASPVRNLDTYGHGTAMAGIIAGRDDGVTKADYKSSGNFVGMAPGARIVSLKVADATGATDVSQVLAAIDWVVQHKNANGMNIRVLNLSFGTDGVQDYQLDPLTYAAEVAWHKGIVVVVSAGNGGYGTPKLNNPAYDPYVIAVGGADNAGTYPVHDDTVPSWSSTGDGARNPDLVAPGASVISLRSPGSFLDTAYPSARQGQRLFRGSGTSQSAAVVSGAAALLLHERPSMTPDQVKRLLMDTAQPLPAANPIAQGKGMVDLRQAKATATPAASVAQQNWTRATGTGSLEAARGSHHVVVQGTELRGEVDVTGAVWDGRTWSGRTWSGSTWSGSTWSGSTWSAGAWLGRTWSGSTWSSNIWNGSTWSGRTWSGSTWSGSTWSGSTWSGSTWSGSTWSGSTWSSALWGG